LQGELGMNIQLVDEIDTKYNGEHGKKNHNNKNGNIARKMYEKRQKH
jgi:hypothetical protein